MSCCPSSRQATGARVNYDTPSFPVYNQRADLELSTGGSAYDVLNVTFIYSSRWIGAGWLTPLDDYIGDPNRTPADWDVADFLPGLRAPETGKDGKLYGIPWTVDTYIAGAARTRPDQGRRPRPARHASSDAAGPAGRSPQGGCRRVRHREPLWLDLRPLSPGLRRRRVPRPARRSDADPGHARSSGGRRVLRHPPARLRPRRRALLFQPIRPCWR